MTFTFFELLHTFSRTLVIDFGTNRKRAYDFLLNTEHFSLLHTCGWIDSRIAE